MGIVCADRRDRAASPDPWEDPDYPALLQAEEALPGPAQRCVRWLAGEDPCRHYGTLLVTIGCEREHVATSPTCECCLGEVLANPLLICETCWKPLQVSRVEPLFAELAEDALIG
jgi:hypothetical protein